MLSEELKGLAQAFESMTARGTMVTLTADVMRVYAAQFHNFADQAAALEGRPVDRGQRDLPEDVIDLTRDERFMRWCRGMVVPPYGPGQGGAA